MSPPSIIVCLIFLLHIVTANVEKTIFLAPQPITIPTQHPTIQDLRLDVLTPDRETLRTHVPAQFPTDAKPRGESFWLLLDDLAPGQRYEARVCWAATQPTAFHLETLPLQVVFDTPELITSLSDFSYGRQRSSKDQDSASAPSQKPGDERTSSLLLLRIHAAADYYTTNATLMRDVPPVHADIILDPYLFNILPRSLVPTAAVLVLVAVISWLVASRLVVPWLENVAAAARREPHPEKKEQ